MSTSEIPTPLYPGINLDENKGPMINSLVITFTVISFIAISLRAFSRWWTRIEVGYDDYLILVAAALSWTFSALMIVEVQRNYFGQHIGKSNLPHFTAFMKIIYAGLELYTMALTFSKLSLLALYLRIFRGSRKEWPIYLAIAANIIWMMTIVFISIFICHPIRGFWDPAVKSKCFPYDKIFISNEALTIALDIVVLIMPAYFISTIKRSVSQRISISSTFLLGLIVTIISVIRLWRLVVSKQREKYGFDPTFNEVDSALWGAVEINLWVVVASLPTLRPLLGKFLRERKESQKSGPSHTYVNSGRRTFGARFGRSGNSLGTTLASLDSRDGSGVEDYNVLIHGKSEASIVGDHGANQHKSPSTYELRQVPHSIRVDREVTVSNPVASTK